MDPSYAEKLNKAAEAPDDAFPSMLFAPLMNDFGDVYFKLGVEDFENSAVKVDPRFTVQNIRRMRGATKRIDVYLELRALWDDYMAYIEDKYGSIEMARELEEQGLLEDVLPIIDHPPVLKKSKARKLFLKGFVPSFMPHGVDPKSCFAHIREIGEQYPVPDEDELVIVMGSEVKLSKEEQEILDRNAERYRRQSRVEMLIGGSGVAGITSNTDFVDNYYANVRRGTYDSLVSQGSDVYSMAEGLKRYYDQLFRHEGQVVADEMRTREDTSGYEYTGSFIRDKAKMADAKVLEHLQKYTGIDLINAAVAAGAGKEAVKGLRARLLSVGASVGMTEKEIRKAEKKARKQGKAEVAIHNADQRLQSILLNNKIFLNGGTVRFEDGMTSWEE